jgi:ATP-dependent DNA ligase
MYPNTSMPKINKDIKIIFNNSMVFCTSTKSILDEMKHLLNLTDAELELYKDAMPYYAGELYKHGISLNIISGQAKNKKTSIDLEYHIFDVFFPTVIKKGHNLTSIYRQKFIDYIFDKTREFELKYIKRVENYKVHNMLEINALADDFISNGYEGAIARKDNGIYRYSFNNYHSRDVLKIKPTFDSEFKIVGFTQGLKGAHLGALIWICATEENLTFHVVPNMEIEERKKLYEKFSESKGESVIGKLLTVSYAELSPKGIPLQPKGIVIRDYE